MAGKFRFGTGAAARPFSGATPQGLPSTWEAVEDKWINGEVYDLDQAALSGDLSLMVSKGARFLGDFKSGLASGDEVSAELNLALQAANGDGFGIVILPPFLLNCDDMIDMSTYSNVRLVGMGRKATVLRMADGANLNTLLRVGAGSGSSQILDSGVVGMTIDGNEANNSAASPVAALEVYNATRCFFDDLDVRESEGVGVKCHGDNINSTNYTQWSRMMLRGNNVGGGAFSDLKYNQFLNIIADNNNDGYGLKLHEGSTEFTQNQLCNILVQGNGDSVGATERAGMIVQGAARTIISNLDCLSNGGAGLSIRSTTDPNSITLMGAFFRRNSDTVGETVQGIEVTQASGLKLLGVQVQGGSANADKVGIKMTDAIGFYLSAECRLVNGTAVQLNSCGDGRLDLDLISNGDAASSENHGLDIQSCYDVTVEYLYGKGSQTSGSSYELNVENSTRTRLMGGALNAQTDGNEINADTSSAAQLDIDTDAFQLRGSATSLPLVSAVSGTATLPLGAKMVRVDTGGANLTNILPLRPIGTRQLIKINDSTPGDVEHSAGGDGQIVHNTGVDWSPGSGDILELVCDGSFWRTTE